MAEVTLDLIGELLDEVRPGERVGGVDLRGQLVRVARQERQQEFHGLVGSGAVGDHQARRTGVAGVRGGSAELADVHLDPGELGHRVLVADVVGHRSHHHHPGEAFGKARVALDRTGDVRERAERDELLRAFARCGPPGARQA